MSAQPSRPGSGPIPDDDPSRTLRVVDPDAPGLPHLGLVGDAYTVLVSGADTAGASCLIDMLVPPGGGPGPHRHDVEEAFVLLEGQVDVTFRGAVTTVRAGQTANIPANAPHSFANTSDAPARMLCLCTPAGQEDLFAAVGDPVPSRTASAPRPEGAELERVLARFAQQAPLHRTELLAPSS